MRISKCLLSNERTANRAKHVFPNANLTVHWTKQTHKLFCKGVKCELIFTKGSLFDLFFSFVQFQFPVLASCPWPELDTKPKDTFTTRLLRVWKFLITNIRGPLRLRATDHNHSVCPRDTFQWDTWDEERRKGQEERGSRDRAISRSGTRHFNTKWRHLKLYLYWIEIHATRLSTPDSRLPTLVSR